MFGTVPSTKVGLEPQKDVEAENAMGILPSPPPLPSTLYVIFVRILKPRSLAGTGGDPKLQCRK